MFFFIFQMKHPDFEYIDAVSLHFNHREAQDVGAGVDAKDAGRLLFQLCQLKLVKW